jgi:ABC-type enterochelin transport system substrate-binding protein
MKKEKNILLIGQKRQHLESLRNIKVLKETIAWFKKQIEPHDCGWMYTTIGGLKHRIQQLRKEQRAQRRR